jgi:hypothetical protein
VLRRPPPPSGLIRVQHLGSLRGEQTRFFALTPSPSPTAWERGAARSPSPARPAGEGDTADKGTALGFAAWGTDALFRPHPQPLSHSVGEGSRAFPLSRPPRGRGDTGGEGNTARLPAHASAGENRPCCSDSVPNRCTLISSFRFPLRAGGTEPVRGSPREAGRNLYPHSVPLAKRGEPAGGGQNPHSRTHSPTPLTQGAKHAII